MKSGSSAFIFSGLQSAGHGGGLVVVPDVAARRHVDLAAGAAHHDDLLVAGAALQRIVGVLLERHLPAAAQAFVGGDDQLGIGIVDAAGERIRAEAAEDDRMHGADAGAGQHGIGRFRDHRQVDGDAVALLDAVLLQNIGEAADMLMEFVVGDLLVVIGIVAFPDDGHLVAALLQMPVDAIVGDVEDAVLVPLDRDIGIFVGRVLDLRGRLEPVDAAWPAWPRTWPGP